MRGMMEGAMILASGNMAHVRRAPTAARAAGAASDHPWI
jgi:hypothetical protein